jgi:hypothetical protein
MILNAKVQDNISRQLAYFRPSNYVMHFTQIQIFSNGLSFEDMAGGHPYFRYALIN